MEVVQLKKEIENEKSDFQKNHKNNSEISCIPGHQMSVSEKEAENKKQQIKKKKKTNRCFACRKKIGIMIFNCKCSDNMFCSSCVLPEKHSCTYNFKEDKESLKKKLVKITSRKVPVI